MNSTQITVPSLKPQQLMSVSINVPYLDMIYERVSPLLANELVSIGISIVVHRMTRVSDQHGDDGDDYEDLYLNEFVLRAVDIEKEMMDRPQDIDLITMSEFKYYSSIVKDFVAHFEEHFIKTHDERCVDQIQLLIDIIEEKKFIDVIRHTYDTSSGYLYIFLTC